MSNGTFSTRLSAPLGPAQLVATVADDPTVVVSSPAFFTVESGTGGDLIREFIYFDDAFTPTQLRTTSPNHRYLAGSTSGSGITHPVGSTVRMVRTPVLTPSHWCNDQSRVDIANDAGLNGIEFVEVIDGGNRLEVHLLTAEPTLTEENFVIDGGDREQNLAVTAAVVAAEVWTLDVDRPGDRSLYRLRVVTSGASAASTSLPPGGFDPMLASIDVRFHVDTASRFDCRHDVVCMPETPVAPAIDYLAKDYLTFRRIMLDRLALHLNTSAEPNAADAVATLVESIAYRADHLSYLQDAVATEAYLGTARRRESVRRHARMLDYRLAEGCNARAWIVVTVGGPNDHGIVVDLAGPELGIAGHPLPFAHDPAGVHGTRFLAGVPDSPKEPAAAVDRRVTEGALVFESLYSIRVRSAHNRIRIYTWGDSECCLPEGTIGATLLGDPGDDPIHLEPGDVLILEEVLSPETGLPADADPAKRQAVRLTAVQPTVDPANPSHALASVQWHTDDALPFALCISARLNDNVVEDMAVARGNVVLADHGYRVAEEDDPSTTFAFEGLPRVPLAPGHRAYRATLRAQDLTIAAPYLHQEAVTESAAAAIAPDSREAVPSAWVSTSGATWRPRADLLASDRFAHEFTIEMTDERRAALRFGDNVYGRAPTPGDQPDAVYRVGGGPAGNVGHDTITTIVDEGVVSLSARNPLSADGGRSPEPVRIARRDAPQAFRVQQRAVTAADYAEVAERHPEVVRAAATRRWTGSWHTMYLTVDRRLGAPVDDDFEAELRAFLDRFRISGHDLEVDGPRFVDLDVAFTMRVADGFHSADVERAVRSTLAAGRMSDGRLGFFHADNYTFGDRVYLSQLLAAVAEVPGVAWVDLGAQPSSGNRFDRLIDPTGDAINLGYIEIDRLEIARLDAGPDHPDRGRLELIVEEAT